MPGRPGFSSCFPYLPAFPRPRTQHRGRPPFPPSLRFGSRMPREIPALRHIGAKAPLAGSPGEKRGNPHIMTGYATLMSEPFADHPGYRPWGDGAAPMAAAPLTDDDDLLRQSEIGRAHV